MAPHMGIEAQGQVAPFDLYPSGWDFGRGGEVARFCSDSEDYWKAHRKDLPKGGVTIPHDGGATLTFSVLKEDCADWIVRVSRILSSHTNLRRVPTSFDKEVPQSSTHDPSSPIPSQA